MKVFPPFHRKDYPCAASIRMEASREPFPLCALAPRTAGSQFPCQFPKREFFGGGFSIFFVLRINMLSRSSGDISPSLFFPRLNVLKNFDTRPFSPLVLFRVPLQASFLQEGIGSNPWSVLFESRPNPGWFPLFLMDVASIPPPPPTHKFKGPLLAGLPFEITCEGDIRTQGRRHREADIPLSLSFQCLDSLLPPKLKSSSLTDSFFPLDLVEVETDATFPLHVVLLERPSTPLLSSFHSDEGFLFHQRRFGKIGPLEQLFFTSIMRASWQ